MALISTKRLHVYLRFGRPVHLQRFDGHVRLAFFAPGQVFCRVWWQGSDYGTIHWTAAVLQAVAPGQVVQHVVGIAPGADVLVHAVGRSQVRQLIELVDFIQAGHLDPTRIPVGYWGVVQNRLAAASELPWLGRSCSSARRRWERLS